MIKKFFAALIGSVCAQLDTSSQNRLISIAEQALIGKKTSSA
jgi:hypothetical protein